MSKITVAADNLYYSSNDDILFNKEKNVLVYYPANKAGNSYTIAENVIAISPDAFNSCANLTSIVIPNSVTQIGNGAFSRAGISTMTIPKSVIEIGHCAFGGGALKEIHFLNNTPPQLIDDSEGEDRMFIVIHLVLIIVTFMYLKVVMKHTKHHTLLNNTIIL